MHNGDNNYFGAPNSVQNAIRKSADEAAADFLSDDRPSTWELFDIHNGAIDCVQKLFPQSRPAQFIILGGFQHFGASFVQKSGYHARSAALAAAIACLAGIAVVRPDR